MMELDLCFFEVFACDWQANTFEKRFLKGD